MELFRVDLMLKPNNIRSEDEANYKIKANYDIGDLFLRNLRIVALVAEKQIVLIILLKRLALILHTSRNYVKSINF